MCRICTYVYFYLTVQCGPPVKKLLSWLLQEQRVAKGVLEGHGNATRSRRKLSGGGRMSEGHGNSTC